MATFKNIFYENIIDDIELQTLFENVLISEDEITNDMILYNDTIDDMIIEKEVYRDARLLLQDTKHAVQRQKDPRNFYNYDDPKRSLGKIMSIEVARDIRMALPQIFSMFKKGELKIQLGDVKVNGFSVSNLTTDANYICAINDYSKGQITITIVTVMRKPYDIFFTRGFPKNHRITIEAMVIPKKVDKLRKPPYDKSFVSLFMKK